MCRKNMQANGWNINLMRKKELHSKLQVARRKDTLFHTFSYVASVITFWEAYILLLLGYEKLLNHLKEKNSSLMQVFCQQNCISVTYLWKHRKNMEIYVQGKKKAKL